LHQNIVFRSYVLDLIFLAMFNDQYNQVTIKSLFDLFNLVVSEKFDILRPNVRMDVKFGDLVFLDELLFAD
jgi:hypothetical protein